MIKNTKTKLPAVICLFLVCVLFSNESFSEITVHDAWYTSTSRDDFTDEVSFQAYTYGEKKYGDYKSIGIRCMDGDLYPIFDAASFIDFGNSYVGIRMRVDTNKTNGFIGRIYSNTNKSGWIPQMAQDVITKVDQKKKIEGLFSEMRQGYNLIAEVFNTRRSNIELIHISLAGFTDAYNQIAEQC